MKKQVICIRWGTKYGPDYVNRLYGMVARNLAPPFDFFCITDDGAGLRPEVRVVPLPELGFTLDGIRHGVWDKSRLWQPKLGDITGPVLFMDLDLVVTGPLDGFFEVGAPEDVILARNPTTPFEKLGQTSLYRFPVGGLVPLWEKFRADPVRIAAEHKFEQRFVTRNAPGGAHFWPRGWVAHFRHHCARTFPLNYFAEPRLPPEARVVIFAGGLNPPDAIAGRWWPHLPVLSRGDHVRAALTAPEHAGSRMRYLRHYIKPTGWVRETWVE
ncbi:glycosyl transferase [Jannaschia formosa]|uniref:glycosyl transferase n=1 Tax=Jannaschia formosa TaxID=2259592 RepID=UPI000E1BAF92|nr:glycosyl transferase [Jannaschia formosa]TFL19042.1 glycosyl transferase [Jannaschia formosa]